MSTGLHLVLLADIGEVIGSVISLLVLLLWVLRQVFEGAKKAQPPRAEPAGGPAPPQAAGGAPPQARPQPAGAGQQADPLRNQVEEFLRRAGRGPQGEQRGGRQRPARPAARSEIEVLVDDEAAAAPERRPLSEPMRPIESTVPSMPPRPQQAAAARKPRQPRRPPLLTQRDAVADHVAESVAAHAKAITEQSSRLGQRIVEEDHQFDVQLKAKFDHTVGTLTGSAVTAAENAAAAVRASETPAAQIAALLASPAGMQQAMVLNEILRRPSDRW